MIQNVTQPEQKLFTVGTEAELEAALNDGLAESHYLDFKREQLFNDSAKKNLAVDVAALAVDGGTLIIGVTEDTSPPSLSAVDLNGLPERVASIASMRPDPAVPVKTVSIPTASDPDRGYLLIQVPPSPLAPHMVDGRYYGRADRTNRAWSDAEVRRLHTQQIANQRDIIADARELLKTLSEGRIGATPMMLLVAKPMGGRHDGPLVPLMNMGDSELRSTVLELVRAAVVAEHQGFAPSFQNLTRVVRRAGGVAATTRLEDEEFLPSDSSAELRLNETGTIILGSRRTVLVPDPADSRQVFEALIIGHTDLLVRLAPLLSTRYGFAGVWRFGLIVTGLRGAISGALAHTISTAWEQRGPAFTDEGYERATDASRLELTQSPEAVVDRLVSSLLRSLNSHQLPQWNWLRP